MRSGVGVDDQTLHVGHVSQQREYLQSIDEAPRRVLSAFHFEGEDAAAAVGKILLVEQVVVMVIESWMMHGRYLWVSGEEIDHLQGVLHVTLYAQTQGLDSLQQYERVEGRNGCTSITQDDGTDAGDVSGSTYCVGKDDAVIRGVGFGERRELVVLFPVELATVNDDATKTGTVTAKEWTTMSAPCSNGRIR